MLPPIGCAGTLRQNKGKTIMIDALAFAVVAVALGVPALITATMLGSKLNFDWYGTRNASPRRALVRQVMNGTGTAGSSSHRPPG
jgi:hypothetical protein